MAFTTTMTGIVYSSMDPEMKSSPNEHSCSISGFPEARPPRESLSSETSPRASSLMCRQYGQLAYGHDTTALSGSHDHAFWSSSRRRIAQLLVFKRGVQSVLDNSACSKETIMATIERRNALRKMVGSDMGLALFDPLGSFECLDSREDEEEKQPPHEGKFIMPENDEDDATRKVEHARFSSSKERVSLLSLTVSTEGESWSFEDAHIFTLESLIEPEPWQDLEACPRILTESYLREIHEVIPDALAQNKWERCFAIGRDGDCMLTLLNRCAPFTYTLLVIQTTRGHVLGGFASESWNVEAKKVGKHAYYGTGQSFLFATHPEILPGIDEEPDPNKELSFFRWSGDNDYCQICNPVLNRLAMGGQGDFGLIIQDNFELGETGRCATYSNPRLVPGGHFEIAALEVYGLVPLFINFFTPPTTPTSSMRSILSV